MAKKSMKIGFKIKLSEETSEKLKTNDGTLDKESVLPPETTSESNEENITQIDVNNSSVTPQDVTSSDVILKEPSIAEKEQVPSSSEAGVSDTSNQYAENIHYEGDQAIYTDPNTKTQYIWCNDKYEWVIRDNSSDIKIDEKNEPMDESDSNIEYENNTYTKKDADGSVYIWDSEKNAWFPKIDDDFLAHYQMAYGFVDNTSSNTEETKKEAEEPVKPSVKKPPEEPKWFEISENQNNKVYVSNLPPDITEEEFVDIMQKCGLVMKDPSTQKMKIKMYTKPNSQVLKGDALCTYIRIESVDLALNILDGYVVRDHRLSVQRAKFQMKGSFNPALKPKKKKKKDIEKLKKMQERLFDWRPEKMRGERSKHEKVVIIKNLFEPSLFDSEVHLLLEYQQDLRDECGKCGEVKKVLLYDRHPEGIAQVTMKEPEEAENVVKIINGRWFGKRQLTAEIWDGKTKYKMEETDADLNKRIDGWNKFLDEGEGDKKDEKNEEKSE